MKKKELMMLVEQIKFDLINIIKARQFNELFPILDNRTKEGFNTEFENEDFTIRIDPFKTLENAKSIIVVGVNYHVDDQKDTFEGVKTGRGSISRTSWGLDYHKVLMKKLQSLVDILKCKYDNNTFLPHVDTGPLVDRHLAYLAGLGFYGENNTIISEMCGSWIYIGYIITDLDFDEYNEIKVEKGCGDCRRCINYCPTNALMGDYTYNATRCIAYLTQTKKNIPYELREKMGSSIYGCDICQIVCPYNNDIEGTDNDDFIPRYETVNPDLIKLSQISKAEFKRLYGDIALGWRGKNVIVRNALIAMGNTRDEKYIDILKDFLSSKSRMLQTYGAWAIARIGSFKSGEILKQYRGDDNIGIEVNNLIKYYNLS